MGFTRPESGSSWLVCAAISAFLTSCYTSRSKLWFRPCRLWCSAENVASLPRPLARLERWQICACHFVEARECRRPSVNWVKSSFRTRSVCYIGRRSEAASAAANPQCLNKRHRVTPSIWIRVHTGASGNESRKWRRALTHRHAPSF